MRNPFSKFSLTLFSNHLKNCTKHGEEIVSKLYSFKAFRGGAQFSKFSPTMKFHQIYEDLQVSEVPNQIFNCINHGEEIISKSYRFRAVLEYFKVSHFQNFL